MSDPDFSSFDELEAAARRNGVRIAFRRRADDRYEPVAFSLATDPIRDLETTTLALLLGEETYIVRRQDLTYLVKGTHKR